jgi:hypothetical protein
MFKRNAFVRGLEELRLACLLKVRRLAKDVFVGCEETLRWPNGYCDDGGVERTACVSINPC